MCPFKRTFFVLSLSSETVINDFLAARARLFHYYVVRVVVTSPPLHAANTSLVHVMIIVKQKPKLL